MNSIAPDFISQFRTSLIKDDVDIITFAQSQDYLGMPLYPRQRTLLKIIFLEDLDEYDLKVIKEWSDEDSEVSLVPRLMERIDYLRQNDYPHFRTIQLIGGRRSGKGYMTAIAIAYKAYLMTQEENISKKFGIAEGKDIYFSIVADSLDQAKSHQFGDAANAILNCKPLLSQGLIGRPIAESVSVKTPADVRKEMALKAAGVVNQRDLASLVIKAFGTNSKTIRGSASLMFIFDEMAHLVAGESRMSDSELWKASIPSVTQFGKNAMIFANSSPYTKTGKFYELYEQAFETDPKDDPKGKILYPDQFMLQFPTWEMYKDWDRDKDKSGPLYVNPKYDPILAREEQADPESFRVEYRSQFAEVIDAFLKPEMVDRMYDPQWNSKWLGRILEPQAGAMGYMRYKGHGDPAAVNANFGIAVGHVEEIVNEETQVNEPHVVFDFIDAFYPDDFKDPEQPDQPGTIDWLEVVPTITQMINAFRPYEFTFDQFDCLDKDTLIPTEFGLLTIEELANTASHVRPAPWSESLLPQMGAKTSRSIDRSVQSMAGVSSIRTLHRKGQTETLTFKTKLGNKISATPEHRLWVRPKKQQAWNKSSEPRWMTANEISAGDCLYVRLNNLMPTTKFALPVFKPSRFHPHTGAKRSPGFNSIELSTLLGLLVGEAYVGDNGISLTNTSREVIDFVRETGNSLFGGGWIESKSTIDHPRWSDSWTIRTGPLLSKYIQKLGVSGKSPEREIPKMIRMSGEEEVAAFMRGLFEGEGGVSIGRLNDEVVRLDTTSEILARQTQLLLLNMGIVSTLWGPHIDWRSETYQPKYRVKIFGRDILTFADKIGFLSKRKMDLLSAAVEQINGRLDRVGLRQRKDRDQNGIWVRIVDVTETVSDTYDLSVPGPESFIANGIVSHNSTMAIQQLQDNLRRSGIGETNVYSKFATPKLNERRWNNFKAALNLGRVHAPHPDTFNPIATHNSIELSRNELKYLQLKNGRIDKQTIGPIQTKDIADCIAEVVDALIGDTIAGGTYNALNQPPQFGAQGGFFIGKGNTDSFGELNGWYQRTGGDLRGIGAKPFFPERGMRKPRK